MSRIAREGSFSADLSQPLPQGALTAVTRSRACLGLVRSNGLLGLFNTPMMRALGFDPSDDLTGLAFASLWRHSERGAVIDALNRAIRSGHARIDLNLSYLLGKDLTCTVGMSLGDGDVVLVTLDCPVD